MCLIFVGRGYPRKLFNLEHFPIYGSLFSRPVNTTITLIVVVSSHGVAGVPIQNFKGSNFELHI